VLAAEAEGEFWAILEQPVEVRSETILDSQGGRTQVQDSSILQVDFWAFSAGSSKPNLGQILQPARPYSGRTNQLLCRLYWAEIVQAVQVVLRSYTCCTCWAVLGALYLGHTAVLLGRF
jgi:hypothetical protein